MVSLRKWKEMENHTLISLRMPDMDVDVFGIL